MIIHSEDSYLVPPKPAFRRKRLCALSLSLLALGKIWEPQLYLQHLLTPNQLIPLPSHVVPQPPLFIQRWTWQARSNPNPPLRSLDLLSPSKKMALLFPEMPSPR